MVSFVPPPDDELYWNLMNDEYYFFDAVFHPTPNGMFCYYNREEFDEIPSVTDIIHETEVYNDLFGESNEKDDLFHGYDYEDTPFYEHPYQMIPEMETKNMDTQLLSQYRQINAVPSPANYFPTPNPDLFCYYGLPAMEDEQQFHLTEARKLFMEPSPTPKNHCSVTVPDLKKFFGLAGTTNFATIDSSIQRFYQLPEAIELERKIKKYWDN